MRTRSAMLLTIVAEAVLQDRLTALVLAEGASGYTCLPCSGQGSRGLRSTNPIGEQNVRIEVVVNEATADRILERLAAAYLAHYAVVAWATPAEVVRADKFGLPLP